MNCDIEQQIDQLLMEQGEYHPLEFLLREGRLNYSDYEAWRNGEIRDLSEMLFGNPEQIMKILEQAAVYLQRRGWESECLVYKQRGGPDARCLRFSQDSRFDNCFHRAYRKPRDQSQLDLFIDTSTTYLVNGITQALKTLNATDARNTLHRLCEAAPDHSQLGELERLVEALESLDLPVSDVEAEIRCLQIETSLLAERHLNKACNHLLKPLWRRLSAALYAHPFDPSLPELHASYTAAQARDWQVVRQAVENEINWQHQPVLLERHANACTYLSDQTTALHSWFLLCWQFPALAGRLEDCGDHTLDEAWRSFLDLEPELQSEDFPAWLLLRVPGLARIAYPDDGGTFTSPQSYRTLYQLQQKQLNAESMDEQAIALRTWLKQHAPQLFHHFLNTL